MKIKFKLFKFYSILFLASINNVSAQEFPISPNGGSSYSVDKFSEEVHFYDFITPLTYKLKTNTVELSIFQSYPFFYNKTHKAIYNVEVTDHGDYKRAKYEYDFATGTAKLLTYAKEFSTMISPNDKIILFPGEGYEDFYSFEDSTYHNYISTPFFKYDISWLNNDSVFYCRDWDANSFIFSYNIWTKQIDTLISVDAENYVRITALESRPNSNEFTYSTLSTIDSFVAMIINYDALTKESKMIFSDEDYPGHFDDYAIFGLKWSPNGKYLSILGERSTGSFSTQNLFIDSLNMPFLIEEKNNILSRLDWINNETIIYENLNEHKIYGFSLKEDISKALSVSENGKSEPHKNFQIIGNYPNPFNPSTSIKINLLLGGEVSIFIYNQLGQLIKTLYSGNMEQGERYLKWDGKNEEGLVQSSGIYFVQATLNNKTVSHKLIFTK